MSENKAPKMNLTQRAKKKLVNSLSKRKKLKITDGEKEKPPPLPRSRPPLPEFMTATQFYGDPYGNLQPSKSLPAQLDQSGAADESIPSSSSTLSTNFTSANNERFRYLDDLAPNSLSWDSLVSPQSHVPFASMGQISSGYVYQMEGSSNFQHEGPTSDVVPVPSPATLTPFLPVQQSITSLNHVNNNTDAQLREESTQSSRLKPGAAGRETDTGHSLESRPQSSNMSQSMEEEFNPRSSPSLTEISPDSGVDGDQFVNNLFSDVLHTHPTASSNEEDTDGEGTLIMDEDRILTADIGIFEEVFESVHQDMSVSIAGMDDSDGESDSTLDFTLSSDELEDSDVESGKMTRVPRFDQSNKNSNGKRGNSVESPNQQTVVTLPKIPRMDSSVLKKIKFFENFSDIKHQGHYSTGSDESDGEQRPARNSGFQHTKNLSLWTSSTSSNEDAPETSSSVQQQNRPTSVFRGFPNRNAPSPRMNFSRFRRSGSIPETVALCICGGNCEGACNPASNGGVQTDSPGGEDSGVEEERGRSRSRRNYCQVCHHPVCTEENSDLPLLLCRQCDNDIHKQPEYSGHLVLDSHKKRHGSARSPSPAVDYDGESDSDGQQAVSEDQVDSLFVKHSSKIRNKSPSSELERKLKRKKALKKKVSKNDGLEAALAQIADPEGLENPTYQRMDSDNNDARRRDSGLGELPSPGALRQDSLESPSDSVGTAITEGGPGTSRVPIRRQSRVTVTDGHFTLKFGGGDGQREDLEVVAAVHNTTLRDALEAVLERRNIDPNSVNVFIEKSRTPLPMSSDTVFLAGNTLEIKEKDDKDLDPASQGKLRPNSGSKSGSNKGSKQSGRSSRRDSVGVVPVLLEPPPSTKQRRGSLQLPFREHFFNKGDSRSNDALKVYDDNLGSLRGRRAGNLSVDDTFYPTSSPQGTWNEGKKNKTQKLSVVNLFAPANKDREIQNQLTEILNRYSSNGLPSLPDLLALGRPKFDESMFELELHWKEIVEGHHNMTKKQQEQQEAVWELLHTEVSYIKQIRVIIDVFQNCLINVQQESFLNEIETERLFSNIDKVFECNCIFWQQYLLPVLLQARETGLPLDPLLCKEGFVDHFPILFQVYFKYFIEHKSCLDYAKSCMESSDLFKTFIMWAEAQKQCNRLKMADLLVKPMQRLLKYSLLLQAILKHTEREKDRNDIKEMIDSVEKLCWAANNSLQRREDYEKLEAVRKTIDLYDAIEAPNDECAKIIQEYSCNFNLLAPMPGFRDGPPRSLLFHSSLRMKEAQNTKLDVDVLLFTDLLLICKSNRKVDRFKIIRPPMRLDQLMVNELKDKGCFLLIYMNEYHVPISAFTFHSDVGAIRGWLEKFREAQKEYKVKKMQESVELEQLRNEGTFALEEVEYTPLSSVPSELDMVSSAFPRSDSMESADRFMPNLLTPNDMSGDLNHSELGRSGSTGDIQNRPSPLAVQREMTHVHTDPRLSDLSPSGNRRSGSASSSGNNSYLLSKHKPVQSCRSVPNITVGSGNAGTISGTSTAAKPHRNSADNGPGYNVITDAPNSPHSLVVSDGLKDTNRTPSQNSLTDQSNVIDEEELAKLKLNSRRVSRTEKRYHTADAIQDMKNSEKDTSIHKRLSWRTDVQVVDHRNLGSKVLSTDSVRSIPSSSGVSSTGSLHLNLESDISEEVENSSAGKGENPGNLPQKIDRRKLFSVGDTENLDSEDRGEQDLADSKQSKSKSTSDLVAMFDKKVHVSDMEDGIASVAVTPDGFNRKLTHADILKMKKIKQQILYDANIESSEV